MPVTLQELGTAWAKGANTPILKVPSVVIEHEFNYVLSPLHPDFPQITWDTYIAFSFDPRLLS